jgi:hypothetical protein
VEQQVGGLDDIAADFVRRVAPGQELVGATAISFHPRTDGQPHTRQVFHADGMQLVVDGVATQPHATMLAPAEAGYMVAVVPGSDSLMRQVAEAAAMMGGGQQLELDKLGVPKLEPSIAPMQPGVVMLFASHLVHAGLLPPPGSKEPIVRLHYYCRRAGGEELRDVTCCVEGAGVHALGEHFDFTWLPAHMRAHPKHQQ